MTLSKEPAVSEVPAGPPAAVTLSKAAAVSKVPAGPPAAVTLSKEPAVSKVPAGPPAVTLSEPAASEVPAGPPQAVAKASSFDSAWRYCQTLPDSPVAPSPKAACKTPEKKRASSAEPGSGSSPKGGSPGNPSGTSTPEGPTPKVKPRVLFRSKPKSPKRPKGCRDKFDKTYYRTQGVLCCGLLYIEAYSSTKPKL